MSTDTSEVAPSSTYASLTAGQGNSSSSGNKQLNLKHLVNLALSSSPKAGVVNFNLLKVFLLELLKALNLQNHEFRLESNALDPNVVGLIENEIEPSSLDAANQSFTSPLIVSAQGSESDRLRALEDKMGRIESQFSALTNSMPSNQAIKEKSKQLQSSSSANSGPVLEIWQYTQMSKRMDASEEGLSKLGSLVQDLINDMARLKDQQEKNVDDIKRLDDLYSSLLDRFGSFEKLKDSLPTLEQFRNLEDELDELKRKLGRMDILDDTLKHLADQIKSIENKIVQFVSHPDLDLYVTWPALENCLKGLREALDSVKQREDELAAAMMTPRPTAPPSAPIATQTTPVPAKTPPPPLIPSPVPSTPTQPETKYIHETVPVHVSRPSSHHVHQPTKELQEILSKLGTLNDRHERLRELVEKLKNELDKKMDKSERIAPIVTTIEAPAVQHVPVQEFRLPDDFGQKIEEIRKIMGMLQELRHNLGIETNKRLEMEKMLANLNNELENIKDSLRECLKNTQLNKNEIQDLKEAIRLLEETKADKNWVRSEFERKADKKDLDLKVNKKTFDEGMSEMSNSINGCISKHSCLEDDWRKGSEKIFKELESKLDRLELNSLKDYIEKQLKKLRKLQKDNLGSAIQALPAINPEDDAAGLRKPLLRFHCLSCDRPLEISHQQAALPSLPAERGLRPLQTPRPYQTFELDQIRQFQKQQMLQDPLASNGYDLYATVRQCGGPHTLTLPQKKLYKIAQPAGSLEEVTYTSSVVNPSPHKSEVQLQGQDGHIYKGRIDARLSVEMKRKIKNSTPGAPSAYQQRSNLTGSASHSAGYNRGTAAASANYANARSAAEETGVDAKYGLDEFSNEPTRPAADF